MAVGRIETAVVFLLVAGVASAVGLAVHSTVIQNETKNAPARAAGFLDADDMMRAQSMGFASPADWRAEVQRRAEIDRIAKAQAEAKAEQSRHDEEVKAVREKQIADAAYAKEKAASDAKKRIDDARFQEGLLYARVLKKSMKNPDSFKLELVTRTAAGMFCFEYRATNSFNAIVPGRAFIGEGKSGSSDDGDGFAAQWNRHCGGRSGDNLSTVAYAINNGY